MDKGKTDRRVIFGVLAGAIFLFLLIQNNKKERMERIRENEKQKIEKQQEDFTRQRERRKIETEKNNQLLQKALALADSSLFLESFKIISELPDSIVNKDLMYMVVRGSLPIAITQLDYRKASSLNYYMKREFMDSSYVDVIENLSQYRKLKGQYKDEEDEISSIKNHQKALDDRRSWIYQNLLRGVIVKKWADDIYECNRGHGGSLFILKTTETIFESPGRFSLIAEKVGTEVVELTNGFSKTVIVWREIGDPRTEMRLVQEGEEESRKNLTIAKGKSDSLKRELNQVKKRFLKSAKTANVKVKL